MAKYSDWRTDLREVMDDDVDEKQVKEKKVNNNKLIKINPKLGEAVEEIGGQILEMKEVDDANKDETIEKDADAEKKAAMADKVKKKEAMLKKRIVRMKMMAVNQGAADSIVAGYEPEGEELKEYSPNVTYQAKGGKKSGKLGKSSVYSLRGKDESKKDFRKSHTKDIKDGLLKKEEVIHERTLSSYIPSDRKGEAHRANLDYTKAQLKKKEDESTKNRGNLSKRDAGKMAKERLRTKKISSLGEEKKKGLDGKACWKGYRLAGTKKKGGKTVDNCVKEGTKKGLWDNIHAKRKRGEKPAKPGDKDYPKTLNVDEGVMKFIKDRVGGKKKPEKKAQMDKTTEKLHDLRRDKFKTDKQKEHEKYVNFLPVDEEVVTELNRFGKETGKATGSINKRPGSSVATRNEPGSAVNVVRRMIRKDTGRPEGQQKKVKGEKGRVQPGDRKFTPAQTISRMRAQVAAADAAMRDTRGT